MTGKGKVCCICATEYTEFGNNPEPLGELPERCCDDCNHRFVIPMRLLLGRRAGSDELIHFVLELAKLGRTMIETQHAVDVHIARSKIAEIKR